MNQSILPVLKSVLAEPDADIVDSATLAIGRIVHRDSAAQCLEELRSTLASRHASVRQSTILSLGVLGSRDAIPTLVEILNDTPEGRRLEGTNNKIQDFERAFAALALGYIGSVDTITVLQDAVTKNTNAERNIRAMSILALGQFVEGREGIVRFLMDQLRDERMDPDVLAQIPISLGRLNAISSIPQLLKLVSSRKTPARVVESSIIALGQLATNADREVLDALKDEIRDGQIDQARHFAIIALAEITARELTETAGSSSETATATIKLLLGELAESRRKAHEPWAGIGLAIVARALGKDSRTRGDIVAMIDSKLERESDPSLRGAYAIALGIADATTSSRAIHTLMLDAKDSSLKGYCAVALGLLRYQEAKPVLRKLVQDTVDSELRLQVATSLGLMGDNETTTLLLTALNEAQTLSVVSSVARAIGLIGDRSAIPALTKVVNGERASTLSRAFACVAFGLLAEKTALPWNARISMGINYRTQVAALGEVLDIL